MPVRGGTSVPERNVVQFWQLIRPPCRGDWSWDRGVKVKAMAHPDLGALSTPLAFYLNLSWMTKCWRWIRVGWEQDLEKVVWGIFVLVPVWPHWKISLSPLSLPILSSLPLFSVPPSASFPLQSSLPVTSLPSSCHSLFPACLMALKRSCWFCFFLT